ncbi:MAG: DegT/DnrJ/EryC1/StrS family aminotransferase [Bacteroidota bacterium]
MIPFSPPQINEKAIAAVNEVLRSGWITTGPKTKLFEKNLSAYNGNPHTICLNSATAGLEIMLRWFGVKEGDEVIVPAYTYCATANVVMHCGAKPVMVDTNPVDFTIDVQKIKNAITAKTKVIMPVDFAGYPCDYDAINTIVNDPEIKKLFHPENAEQKTLGRILVLSDAAHSVGAKYKGKHTGTCCDISVFSFHAVKNLVTAEGGAVALNLPAPFNNEEIYKYLCIKSLHGQNKDALAKTQVGAWRYDVIEPGFKCNMTDIMSAIGLVELERYDEEVLPRRKEICKMYSEALGKYDWAQLPVFSNGETESCYHLYPLRIKNVKESQRDAIIQKIFEKQVSVNVHFIPLAMLSVYKNIGYNINDYPVAYDNYSREISLPVHLLLSNDNVDTVIHSVIKSVEEVLV